MPSPLLQSSVARTHNLRARPRSVEGGVAPAGEETRQAGGGDFCQWEHPGAGSGRHPTHGQATPVGFTLVEIMVVVVIVGLLASMAITQFSKIRMRSQDAAVLNNVRQLASASTQYFLENGVSVASFSDLTSAPSNIVKNLQTLAGETYPLHYTQGEAITVTGIGGSRTITYQP